MAEERHGSILVKKDGKVVTRLEMRVPFTATLTAWGLHGAVHGHLANLKDTLAVSYVNSSQYCLKDASGHRIWLHDSSAPLPPGDFLVEIGEFDYQNRVDNVKTRLYGCSPCFSNAVRDRLETIWGRQGQILADPLSPAVTGELLDVLEEYLKLYFNDRDQAPPQPSMRGCNKQTGQCRDPEELWERMEQVWALSDCVEKLVADIRAFLLPKGKEELPGLPHARGLNTNAREASGNSTDSGVPDLSTRKPPQSGPVMKAGAPSQGSLLAAATVGLSTVAVAGLAALTRLSAADFYEVTVSSYVIAQDYSKRYAPGEYQGYVLVSRKDRSACQAKDEWLVRMEKEVGLMKLTSREEAKIPSRCTIRKWRLSLPSSGWTEVFSAFRELTDMSVLLNFNDSKGVLPALNYTLMMMEDVDGEQVPTTVATVTFTNPRSDSVLVIVPIDFPEGQDILHGCVEKAIKIGRKVSSYNVMTPFTVKDLNGRLDSLQPDILFICCHREEEIIFLGKKVDKHLTNEQFLDIFLSRKRRGAHNPSFVIFSTCGGKSCEEGEKLPKALVDEKCVDFVVYWLGEAMDDVLALYSGLLVKSLEIKPLTSKPIERHRKSHFAAVAELPQAIRDDPRVSKKWLKRYLDSIEQIRCYPNPECAMAPAISSSS